MDQAEQPAPAPAPAKKRFKVVGKVVLALQRFKASLNPTVSFGKARDAPARDKAPRPAARPLKAKDRTASGRTFSGRPTLAGQAHGHRAGLLLRPLPPVAGGGGGGGAAADA
ncbi:hypothetical protein Rsub_03290 [Raphidocelis subcapitata]|uniref:Uncharacterized protein n=1 Tax=Raphidocelis subcapitata TaxID=307507 RepID=A0A2V0NZ05_9CHLO|nr:hypothetical protein Rsub_03290 [Raphidocelis subcapitata]|eukprot:GBF90157.1 hypothetical protein Rsub_03290 [Raphidocelis subcapitata]